MAYSIKAVEPIVHLFGKINKFGSLPHTRISFKRIKQSEVLAEIKDYILILGAGKPLCKTKAI